MCGIAGYIGTCTLSEGQISHTLDRMRNRGPDARASRHFSMGGKNVYFLHSRLSILDLDPRSNQPFERDGIVVVFNGEIYNYVELREELKKKGHVFTTESDTEVLVQAYRAWGRDCLTRFEGMWSFALYDSHRNTILLSRDRFGEKPLFLLPTPDGLYFGSEPKFLSSLSGKKLAVNQRQILRYLVNGYKSLHKHGETFFEGVASLPQSSSMYITASGAEPPEAYWQLRYAPRTMSRSDAIEGTKHHLIQSLKLRLRADVPLAFCLSGGVDSSSLVSIAAKQFHSNVSCYSIIDTDPRYDESENMRAVVEDTGCEWTTVTLQPERSLDRLTKLIQYHDAPVVTLSYYVHSRLSELISSHGKKVAFSGTSADELFSGYYDHYLWHLYECRNLPQFPTLLNEWKTHVLPKTRNPLLQSVEPVLANPNFREHIYLDADEFRTFLRVPFHEAFIEKTYCDDLMRNRLLNELFVEATPVILAEDDLNSMYYSIENRSPFLDAKLAEFAFSIPSEHLIHNGFNKSILRDAMSGILVDKPRLDRQKKGFNAAIESVFALNDSSWREMLLDQSPLFEIVDRTKLETLTSNAHFTNSWSKFIFSVVSAKLFVDSYA